MTAVEEKKQGRIVGISGPVVDVTGLPDVRLNDVLNIGEVGLVGEVIRLRAQVATAQIYEETSGLRVGEPASNTGRPLSALLGPGMLGQVFDGLQRPLDHLAEKTGSFIQRGQSLSPLSPERKWMFTPELEPGDHVEPGQILGQVQETGAIQHRILVPPETRGRIRELAAGEYTIDQKVGLLETDEGGEVELRLAHWWPIRRARPSQKELRPDEPLITGTRVIDALFPLARGGAAVIPGGFGTGKTVLEQTLARFADVDVVVYVGCGERGNEMADLLESFPKLKDPRTGAPLMERTVLIANTSNMPVAARESSIYTGVTIAEYFRDMGYDALLLADSTSRWGEALREISGVLEEMPAEEGFPAYLAANLAEFYERAGHVIPLGSGQQKDPPRRGSVSVVGAVSPPAGDFSEPITQNSMRLAGTFWALDTGLARRRHFPAIDWNQSFSLYELDAWFRQEADPEWPALIAWLNRLLEAVDRLEEIVQLIGPEALSTEEQLTLFVGRTTREDFMQQLATSDVDAFSPLPKTLLMLKVLRRFDEVVGAAREQGYSADEIQVMDLVSDIAQMKLHPPEQAEQALENLLVELNNKHEELAGDR